MDDFRECWQTMPDDDLREIYRSKLKAYKRLGTIAFAPLLPAWIIYGFLGWTGFFSLEMSGFQGGFSAPVGGAFYYLALAVSSVFMRTASVKNRWLIFVPMVVTVPFVAWMFGYFSIEPVIMVIFLGYAYRRMGMLMPDLEFLRELPNFPFNNRTVERDIRIMSFKAAEDYLNISSGKVVSTDYEKIFTAERPEEIAAPPEKTEEYFQQHKMMYKNMH